MMCIPLNLTHVHDGKQIDNRIPSWFRHCNTYYFLDIELNNYLINWLICQLHFVLKMLINWSLKLNYKPHTKKFDQNVVIVTLYHLRTKLYDIICDKFFSEIALIEIKTKWISHKNHGNDFLSYRNRFYF